MMGSLKGQFWHSTLEKLKHHESLHIANINVAYDSSKPYNFDDKNVTFSVSGNDFGESNPTVTQVSPWFLAAKSSVSKDNNPNWCQAMQGPFAEEYWKEAQVKIGTLKKWVPGQ